MLIDSSNTWKNIKSIECANNVLENICPNLLSKGIWKDKA